MFFKMNTIQLTKAVASMCKRKKRSHSTICRGVGDTGRGTPPPPPHRRLGPSRGASAAGRFPGEVASFPGGRAPGTSGRFFLLLQTRPSLLIPGHTGEQARQTQDYWSTSGRELLDAFPARPRVCVSARANIERSVTHRRVGGRFDCDGG